MSRYQYKVEDVVGDLHSSRLPTTLNRTFLEHKQLRNLLKSISRSSELHQAVELGMGYGRMTPVIAEIASTIGCEREPELRNIAASLLPNVKCPEITSLSQLPIDSNSVDLVVSWTVLQHMHDDELTAVIAEVNRITKNLAWAVFCEHTAPTPQPANNKETHVCIGRSFEKYLELLGDDWTQLSATARVKEATNKSAHVGTLMVFRKIV